MSDDTTATPSDHARPPTRFERVLYDLVRRLAVLVARLLWRLEVHGAEKVPPGPFVLSAVHRSNIDFLLVSAVTRRRLRYMGKHTIWKYEGLGRFFTALGAFPVHRGSADREALRTSQAVLQAGEPVVMFPEGTRRTGPVVQELFEGPAFVASRTGVPILPVGIGGSEAAMPPGSKLIRPGKIVLVIGDPIPAPTAEEGRRVARRQIRETTDQLHMTLQELFDAAQRRAGRPNVGQGPPPCSDEPS